MPFLAGRGQSSRGYFGGGTVPNAPTALSSVPANGQLTVSFTPPEFNGGLDITNYEYSVNAGATWVAFSPVDIISPVVITGLENGTAYIVYLRAVNSLGAGIPSSALTTGTTPFTNSTAPTSLSSIAGNTQLAISFTAPSDTGGYAITNYEYALSTNSGSTYGSWTALSPVDATSPITISGLTNGQAYYVKLRAVTSAAVGAESVAVTTNTMPFTTPTAPTSLSSTAGNTQLSLAFTAPTSSGGPAITNYEYALSTNGGTTFGDWTALSPADATSPVTITGLVNGTVYRAKLRAVTSLAVGAESVVVLTNTTPFTTPTAPTSLSSLAGNTQLTISFTAPTSNGGFPITNYEYALSTNSGSTYGSWTALSPVDAVSPVTIGGLTNGQAYYVKLRAITSAPSTGTESVAVTANTTPFTIASAPTIGTVTTSISSPNTVSTPTMSQDETNASFSWSNPGAGGVTLTVPFTAGSNGGSTITNYQYSTDNGATFKSAGTTSSPISITTISGSTALLAAATDYNVLLRAVNAAGNGTASTASAKTTPAAVTSYTVYVYDNYTTDNTLYDTVSRTTADYAISHYKAERKWSVTVKANNANGSGTVSAESGTATGWEYDVYNADYARTRPCESGTGCDSCGTRTGTTDGTVARNCYKWTRAGSTTEDGLACVYRTIPGGTEEQNTTWDTNCRDLEASCSASWIDVTGNYTPGQTLSFAGINWTIGSLYGFANFAYKTADPGDGGACPSGNARGYSLYTCGASQRATQTFEGCIPI